MEEPITLFERLALSQVSSHLEPADSDHIGDIERVTALGFAGSLGSMLIRLKGANDPLCYEPAVETLVSRLYWIGKRQKWSTGTGQQRLYRVAREAVRFYMFDQCPTCGGRGKLAHSYTGPAEDDAGQVCPACGGSGKAHRNVQKRAGTIFEPGDIPQRLEAMLDAADAILMRAELQATGISRAKLAR